MLIIFDLDDTLIDTAGTILSFRQKAAFEKMVRAGLCKKTFQLKQFVALDQKSISSKEALKKFLGEESPYYAIGYKEIYESEALPELISLTPGALEVLNELKKENTLAIVSYGIDRIQHIKIKKAGLDRGIFSTIDVCKSTDKSMAYQKVFENFKGSSEDVIAEDVIVCGDRERDLKPAKELGFRTVHMRWGRGKDLHVEADASIQTLSEMVSLIKWDKKK